MERIRERCRGSLVGGAAGDALGYAVEFDSLREIRKRFGQEGIREYELEKGVAHFSDDTQMSLFTAVGILDGVAAGASGTPLPEGAAAGGSGAGDSGKGAAGGGLLAHIRDAYLRWYDTQTMEPVILSSDWLTCIRRLWERRAPGNTCMSALAVLSRAHGKRQVANRSKGCGGVMRVAPAGIYYAARAVQSGTAEGRYVPADEQGMAGAEQYVMEAGLLAGMAADLTHKHPLSTYASMAHAMIVAECILADNIDREKFRSIVIDRVFGLLEGRHKEDSHLKNLKGQVEKALDLAVSDMPDAEGIRRLGEGWVGDEALAIALYCVMRYIDDFGRCIVCAVNHDGDSDSTGAIAGNIIGAILCYSKIPSNYLDSLELRDVLVSVADDLCGCSSEEQMTERYIHHRPYGVAREYLI